MLLIIAFHLKTNFFNIPKDFLRLFVTLFNFLILIPTMNYLLSKFFIAFNSSISEKKFHFHYKTVNWKNEFKVKHRIITDWENNERILPSFVIKNNIKKAEEKTARILVKYFSNFCMQILLLESVNIWCLKIVSRKNILNSY